MSARLARHDASARIDGLMIQEMVSGVEMILGAGRPQFGPFMLVGLGGIMVELSATWRSACCRSTNRQRARCWPRCGARRSSVSSGRPACDNRRDGPGDDRVVALFLDHRAFPLDFEINPLMVRAKGRARAPSTFGWCRVNNRSVDMTYGPRLTD